MSGGPHPVHEGGGRPPRARPPISWPPGDLPTPTPNLYICFWGEKNREDGFVAFYDMEPPPSPKTSREG